MRLYIIRHAHVTYRRGVPLASVPPEERSHLPDPPITEMGRKQASLLGQHLSRESDPGDKAQARQVDRLGFTISRLFCSPMRRALQTARPIAAALGLRPEIWVDLHELGGVRHDEGDGQGACNFPGLSRAEVEQSFPEFLIPSNFAELGWWNPPPEGDRPIDRLEGVAEELRTLALATDEHIAIVTHGTAASYILHGLLGSTEYEKVYLNHAHTGMSSLTIRDNETTLRYQNRVEHLPDDLVTG